MISRTSFGVTPKGLPASTYTLSAGPVQLTLTDFGAAVQSLKVVGSDNKQHDIVLGFDKLEDYFDNPACHGATIGPSANRIDKAEVPLHGTLYHLPKNDGPSKQNNLHTDLARGLHKRLWHAAPDDEKNAVVFTLSVPDGEFGLPGARRFTVCYALVSTTTGTELLLSQECVSDQPTFVNMTNHMYFNLSGHNSGTVRNHAVRINAKNYLPLRADCVSQGLRAPVAGGPFDFRSEKLIGADIDADNEQLHIAHGYDHCFCIDGYRSEAAPRVALAATGAKARLEIALTAPGAHFYTGNWLNDRNAKEGAIYRPNDGFAFEPEFYPDCIHHPEWDQPICEPEHPWHSKIVYRITPR